MSKPIILEVIATNVTDAKIAEQSGADRIELITGILEGGLTPSYGLIEEAVRSVSIPVHVMVRPHSHSFCYSQDDMATMRNDIRAIKQLGASGVVIGALTEDNKIDVASLQLLLNEAGSLDITFHRAFDEVTDQIEALEVLSHFPQIRRVLTSGGKKSVVDAVEKIKKLTSLTENTHLSIMAGSGLKISNIRNFLLETGVKEVHFGTGVRTNEQPLQFVDPEKVAALKGLINI